MLKASTRFGFPKQVLLLVGILFLESTMIDFILFPGWARSDTSTPIASNNKQAKGQVPGRKRGGARRGDCAATSRELTALVPAIEVPTQTLPETYVGGSTTAEHPTFWFYVPYSITADLTAEFILQDDTGQDIYRITSADFPSSEQTPGIISISIPSTISPLKIGKVYRWYFKLNCGLEASSYVKGGIERISLDPKLANQLANASPQEQAKLYLTHDAWYDAATILAQLHRTNSIDKTIKSTWINLLRSIGLEDIPVN
jgi:hypothetical protein